MNFGTSFSAQAAAASKSRVGNDLVYIKKSAEGFIRTLFTDTFEVTYLSGVPGATDAKGKIILDGEVAEDSTIPAFNRADIIKGVLLDEIGHNLHPPIDKYRITREWINHCDRGWVNPAHKEAGISLVSCIHNLVEDIHNVWALTAQFPGFRSLHSAAVSYYLGDLAERIAKYEMEAAVLDRPTLDTTVNALIAACKHEMEIDESNLEAIRQTVMEVGNQVHDPSARGYISITVTDLVLDLLSNWESSEPESDEGDDEANDDQTQNEAGDNQTQGESDDSTDPVDGQGEGSDSQTEEDSELVEITNEASGDLEGDRDEEQIAQDLDEMDTQAAQKSESEVLAELVQEADELDEVTKNAGMKTLPDAVDNPPEDDSDSDPNESVDNESYGFIPMDITHNPRPMDKSHDDRVNFVPNISQLAAKVVRQTRFQSTAKTKRSTGYRRGKLAARDAHKLASGRLTPFSQTNVVATPDIDLVVVLDGSGSMSSHNRWEIAINVVEIMDRAYSKMKGVRFSVVDYSHDDGYFPVQNGIEKINIRVLRDPNSGYKVPLNRVKLPGGQTPTVPAMEIGHRMFEGNRQRVMVLITDGDPNIGGDNVKVHEWMQKNRDCHLVQIILGKKGADVPATYKVEDDGSDMKDRINRVASIIGKAVSQRMRG